MTHNANYNDRMKYKAYDRNKHKTHDQRNHNYMASEAKIDMMIKRYKEEIKQMKYEMEMY